MPWYAVYTNGSGPHAESIDHYTFLKEGENVEEHRKFLRDETNEEHDPYYSVRLEAVDAPPAKWLETEIKAAQLRIDSARRWRELLTAALKRTTRDRRYKR